MLSADEALEEDRLPFGPPFLLDRKRDELRMSLRVSLRMKDCLSQFPFHACDFMPSFTDSADDKSMSTIALLLG